MEIDLTGRTAIVTGGSKGLGLAMATRFAASGADVALLARRADVLEEVRTAIAAVAKGRVATVPCDVSKAPDIEPAHARGLYAFRQVASLVNNSGESRA